MRCPENIRPFDIYKLSLHSEDKEKLLRDIKNSVHKKHSSRGSIQESKTEYIKILSRSKVFKNDAEKINYLIKELENATVKMKMLEMNIKSLKEENLRKTSFYAQENEDKKEVTRLRKEISYLKSVIIDQNEKLEQFKKQVIDKFCSNK